MCDSFFKLLSPSGERRQQIIQYQISNRCWGHRCRWEDRRAGARLLYFSCTDDQGDLYQMHFDGNELVWHLDAVQLAGGAAARTSGRPGGR